MVNVKRLEVIKMRNNSVFKKISDIFIDYQYAFQLKAQLEREMEFNKRKSSIKTTNNDSIKSTKTIKIEDKYNDFIFKNERYERQIEACQLYIDKVDIALEFLKKRNERIYNVVHQRYLDQKTVKDIIAINKIGKSTYWVWLGRAEEILNNAMFSSLDTEIENFDWTRFGVK